MPSGQVHLKASLATSAFLAPLLFGAAVGASSISAAGAALAVGAGLGAGCLLTPDMDVDAGNYSYSVIRRTLGGVGAMAFALYWQPYAFSVRHRSIISHGILVGTLVRFIYLLFPILVFIINESYHSRIGIFIRSIASQILALPLLIFFFLMVYYGTITVPILVLFLISWSILDVLHILMDRFF